MKTEWAIVKRLVLDWKTAIENPEIARACVLQKRSFTSPDVRLIVQELVLAGGDLARAVASLSNMPQRERPWLTKFMRWCDKVRGGAK